MGDIRATFFCFFFCVFKLYWHIACLNYVKSVHIVVIQDGWTALHIASANGYVDIVQLLLKHNADINVKGEV